MSVDVAEIIRRWGVALNTGDIPTLVALYAEDAVLMPAFSLAPVVTQAQIREYFYRLVERPQLAVEFDPDVAIVRPAGAGCYVASGAYSFRFAREGKLLLFPSWFTFVVAPADRQPLLHHHSSPIPDIVEA